MGELAFNEVIVRCPNPKCQHYGKERSASLPTLGNGLYLTGGVMCECNFGGETIRVAGLGYGD